MHLIIKVFFVAKLILVFASAGVSAVQAPASEQVSVLAAEAREAEQIHDYARAVEAYKKLVRLVPASGELYSNLGIAYHMRGEFEFARQSFEKALSLESQLVAPKVFLGIEYELQSRPEKAIEYLSKAVGENPADPLARKWLAQGYFDRGE